MPKEEEKEEKTGLIELETLKDLIHLIMRTPFPTINHVKLTNNHYYFMVMGGFAGVSRLIYYISQPTEIKESFIVYNNLEDTISFDNKLETRGGITHLPIIHIKSQNILTPEDFKF